MATVAGKNRPPIDITSRRAQPGLPFVFPLRATRADQLWQTVKIAAGYAAATAVLLVAWFALLSLVYQSFARFPY